MSRHSKQPASSQKPMLWLLAMAVVTIAGAAMFAAKTGLYDPPGDHVTNGIPGADVVEQPVDAVGKAKPHNAVPVNLPAMPTGKNAAARQDEVRAGLDPRSVQWNTETFDEESSVPLKRLASIIKNNASATADALRELSTPDFTCRRLRPSNLTEAFRDSVTTVRRSTKREEPVDPVLRAAEGLQTAVQTLPTFVKAADNYVKLKNIGIVADDAAITTRVYAEGSGVATSGTIHWTAVWSCRWHRAEESRPRLDAIRVLQYEETESSAETGTWLVDCSASVMGGAQGYSDQLMVGTDTWVNRLEARLHVSRLGHNGIAVGDASGDGRDDIYVCQSGGLPNRLYLQQPDGTVRDVAGQANVDFLDDTTCALLVDLDNDGDQDLAVVTVSGSLVLENDGAGIFNSRTYLPECRNAFSLTAADYDQDRLLDLYIGRYWPSEESRGEVPIPVPYYDANNGGKNILLRNAGDWVFEDVTASVGLDQHNTRYTMAAAWEDLDADGDVDLYVANDFGRNCWYENERGQFTNLAADRGIEDIASGMSVSYADFDHDGRTDIYVSNMFSSAGNRTTSQRQYANRFAPDDLSKLQRLARGNSLFRATGGNTFEDVSVAAKVTMGRWAWGSLFADLNNDSWDDILVANGFLSTEDSGDL